MYFLYALYFRLSPEGEGRKPDPVEGSLRKNEKDLQRQKGK